MMKIIKLQNNKECVVDAADYEELSKYRWFARMSDGGKWYVARNWKYGENHIFMHRQILNTPQGLYTDHINGNGLDNRRANLRVVTTAQNMANKSKQSNGLYSRYKGVTWNKQRRKWQVQVKAKTVGRFDSEIEAALKYNEVAKEVFGEYAKLNDMPGGETQDVIEVTSDDA